MQKRNKSRKTLKCGVMTEEEFAKLEPRISTKRAARCYLRKLGVDVDKNGTVTVRPL